MSKRRKRQPDILSRPDAMAYLELRVSIIQHCAAIKAVCDLLAQDKKELAIARLDQATKALGATIRGQATGVTMPCPGCGSEQDITAWVDNHECDKCGLPLVWPGENES